jgi:hypothetical protein
MPCLSTRRRIMKRGRKIFASNNRALRIGHSVLPAEKCPGAIRTACAYHAVQPLPRRFCHIAARVQSAARPFLSQRRKDGVLGGTELRQRQYLMPVAHFRPAWLSIARPRPRRRRRWASLFAAWRRIWPTLSWTARTHGASEKCEKRPFDGHFCGYFASFDHARAQRWP